MDSDGPAPHSTPACDGDAQPLQSLEEELQDNCYHFGTKFFTSPLECLTCTSKIILWSDETDNISSKNSSEV